LEILNPGILKTILNTLAKTKSSPDSGKESFSTAQNWMQSCNYRPSTALKQEKRTYDFKSSQLSQQEQSAFMKDLLNLPQDFKKFLVLMMDDKNNTKNFIELLKDPNQKLNANLIRELLDANSKEVLGKIIKLIQQSPENVQNHEMLKTLMAVLKGVVPGKESQPEEIFTQLILLYLPWLPLTENQKLEVRFEKKKGGQAESDENVAMVLYISTINLGRFKIVIILDTNNIPDIHIENTDDKEVCENNENREKILKNILENLKLEFKNDNMKANTKLFVTAQKDYLGSGKREITVSKINNISPVVILTAQKIAQAIIEMDEKISLVIKRGEMIQE
jgi:hypothetical protein